MLLKAGSQASSRFSELTMVEPHQLRMSQSAAHLADLSPQAAARQSLFRQASERVSSPNHPSHQPHMKGTLGQFQRSSQLPGHSVQAYPPPVGVFSNPYPAPPSRTGTIGSGRGVVAGSRGSGLTSGASSAAPSGASSPLPLRRSPSQQQLHDDVYNLPPGPSLHEISSHDRLPSNFFSDSDPYGDGGLGFSEEWLGGMERMEPGSPRRQPEPEEDLHLVARQLLGPQLHSSGYLGSTGRHLGAFHQSQQDIHRMAFAAQPFDLPRLNLAAGDVPGRLGSDRNSPSAAHHDSPHGKLHAKIHSDPAMQRQDSGADLALASRLQESLSGGPSWQLPLGAEGGFTGGPGGHGTIGYPGRGGERSQPTTSSVTGGRRVGEHADMATKQGVGPGWTDDHIPTEIHQPWAPSHSHQTALQQQHSQFMLQHRHAGPQPGGDTGQYPAVFERDRDPEGEVISMQPSTYDPRGRNEYLSSKSQHLQYTQMPQQGPSGHETFHDDGDAWHGGGAGVPGFSQTYSDSRLRGDELTGASHGDSGPYSYGYPSEQRARSGPLSRLPSIPQVSFRDGQTAAYPGHPGIPVQPSSPHGGTSHKDSTSRHSHSQLAGMASEGASRPWEVPANHHQQQQQLGPYPSQSQPPAQQQLGPYPSQSQPPAQQPPPPQQQQQHYRSEDRSLMDPRDAISSREIGSEDIEDDARSRSNLSSRVLVDVGRSYREGHDPRTARWLYQDLGAADQTDEEPFMGSSQSASNSAGLFQTSGHFAGPQSQRSASAHEDNLAQRQVNNVPLQGGHHEGTWNGDLGRGSDGKIAEKSPREAEKDTWGSSFLQQVGGARSASGVDARWVGRDNRVSTAGAPGYREASLAQNDLSGKYALSKDSAAQQRLVDVPAGTAYWEEEQGRSVTVGFPSGSHEDYRAISARDHGVAVAESPQQEGQSHGTARSSGTGHPGSGEGGVSIVRQGGPGLIMQGYSGESAVRTRGSGRTRDSDSGDSGSGAASQMGSLHLDSGSVYGSDRGTDEKSDQQKRQREREPGAHEALPNLSEASDRDTRVLGLQVPRGPGPPWQPVDDASNWQQSEGQHNQRQNQQLPPQAAGSQGGPAARPAKTENVGVYKPLYTPSPPSVPSGEGRLASLSSKQEQEQADWRSLAHSVAATATGSSRRGALASQLIEKQISGPNGSDAVAVGSGRCLPEMDYALAADEELPAGFLVGSPGGELAAGRRGVGNGLGTAERHVAEDVAAAVIGSPSWTIPSGPSTISRRELPLRQADDWERHSGPLSGDEGEATSGQPTVPLDSNHDEEHGSMVLLEEEPGDIEHVPGCEPSVEVQFLATALLACSGCFWQ